MAVRAVAGCALLRIHERAGDRVAVTRRQLITARTDRVVARRDAGG